ncbi:MAG: hypothetical protein ACOYEH_03435 [Caldicoprobacterales bacterium]
MPQERCPDISGMLGRMIQERRSELTRIISRRYYLNFKGRLGVYWANLH